MTEADQQANTSFDDFAEEYDKMMGDTGDISHQNTIDKSLFKLIGDVRGLKIYDLACGNGYIARRFVREGAVEVFASDISTKLITIAKSSYDEMGIRYLSRPAEDFSGIPENYFDLITMNMAIFYIQNLDDLFKKIFQALVPGGRFVFTYDHPLRLVAYFKMGFMPDIQNEYEHYLDSGLRLDYNHWTGKKDLAIYRRPLGEIINALGRNGLFVRSLDEPKTTGHLKDREVVTNIPYKIGVEAVKV